VKGYFTYQNTYNEFGYIHHMINNQFIRINDNYTGSIVDLGDHLCQKYTCDIWSVSQRNIYLSLFSIDVQFNTTKNVDELVHVFNQNIFANTTVEVTSYLFSTELNISYILFMVLFPIGWLLFLFIIIKS